MFSKPLSGGKGKSEPSSLNRFVGKVVQRIYRCGLAG